MTGRKREARHAGVPRLTCFRDLGCTDVSVGKFDGGAENETAIVVGSTWPIPALNTSNPNDTSSGDAFRLAHLCAGS